jgi:hypothetical protein
LAGGFVDVLPLFVLDQNVLHDLFTIFDSAYFTTPFFTARLAGQVDAFFVAEGVGFFCNVLDAGGETPWLAFDGSATGRAGAPANFSIMLAKPAAKVV